jgi:hypothetical protein
VRVAFRTHIVLPPPSLISRRGAHCRAPLECCTCNHWIGGNYLSRTPESVRERSGAGDGNSLEPLNVAAAYVSLRIDAGGESHDVNVVAWCLARINFGRIVGFTDTRVPLCGVQGVGRGSTVTCSGASHSHSARRTPFSQLAWTCSRLERVSRGCLAGLRGRIVAQ